MADYSETGIAVLALTVVLASFKLFDHYMARRNGNGYDKRPIQMTCPNKIEGLYEALHKIESTVKKTSEDSKESRSGVERLVGQHAPEGGIESWKILPSHMDIWNKIERHQAETVAVVKSGVQLQKDSNVVLKRQAEISTDATRVLTSQVKLAENATKTLTKQVELLEEATYALKKQVELTEVVANKLRADKETDNG